MNLSLSIQSRSTVLMARHATQLLTALVVLRDGLALTLLGEPLYEQLIQVLGPELIAQLNASGQSLLSGGRPYERSLEDLGEIQRQRERYDLAIQKLLRYTPLGDGLELHSIQKGSIVVVFKDTIGWIHNRLKEVLSGSRDLMPEGNRERFREVIQHSLNAARAPSHVRQLSAGFIATGVSTLETVLVAINAEAIDVKDEEVKDEQMNSAMVNDNPESDVDNGRLARRVY